MEGIRISNKEYRQREGVSSSELKNMVKSPMHCKYWRENPMEKETPALLFGKAVHKYVLEKDDFFSEFAVAPNINRRTKAGKEEWALFEFDNQDKCIISSDDFEEIKDMYEALYSTPYVERLLSGAKELSFFMEDENTGLTIKCRPDCLTDIGDTHILIDYKSCTDATSEQFMKDSIKFMYDLQMAYYKDILDKQRGCEHTVIFIAQEKTAPYLVNVLEANEYFIKSGRDMYRTCLDMYAECEKSGNWYGLVNGGINTLGLPNWLQKQYEV